MAIDVAAQLQAIYARSSTPVLIESLRTLEKAVNTNPTPELRLSRSWVITELERRYPAASAAVDLAFEQDEERVAAGADPTEIDYVAALLTAIPTN